MRNLPPRGASACDMTKPFEPDWTTPPGDTILEALEFRTMSLDDFCDAMHMTTLQASELISGRGTIGQVEAERLDALFGYGVQFWLNREANYRADLVRLAAKRKT